MDMKKEREMRKKMRKMGANGRKNGSLKNKLVWGINDEIS